MASSLDLANVVFRAVSSEPDRMQISIMMNDIRSWVGTTMEIGELVKRGGDETGSFESGARWYLDDVYFQDNRDSDLRSVIRMEGYCQIIQRANQLLALADHASDTGGGGANHRNDDADAASIDASE